MFGKIFPPQKTPLWSAPTRSGTSYHFCGACCPAFNGFNRVKIGLHLAKLGRTKNFVDFSPKKLPFVVPLESCSRGTIFPVWRAESNAFYRVEISLSVPKIQLGAKMAYFQHIPKFQNSLRQKSRTPTCENLIYLVPDSQFQNHVKGSQKTFRGLPQGAKYPFSKISKRLKDFPKFFTGIQ